MDIKAYTSTELRKLRSGLKQTQSQVAESIGINKDTLVRYENSNSNISLDILDKLLDYYGVTFDIFFKNYNANKH